MAKRESANRRGRVILDGADPLAAAVAFAREFGQAVDLSRDDHARLCIIVEELIANLIDHGHAGSAALHLSLIAQAAAIRLELTDSGRPFDPRRRDGASDRRGSGGGGSGLALVHAWAQISAYSRIDGRNRLELLLPLNGASPPPAR